MLLTEALESRVYLDPKQLAFLADNEDTVILAQASQEISSPAAFQTYDLDAFDFDCDDEPSAKAIPKSSHIPPDAWIDLCDRLL
nr:hypothetical protein [Tanacetum cinerariifolium]